jgi:hypothetical protein
MKRMTSPRDDRRNSVEPLITPADRDAALASIASAAARAVVRGIRSGAVTRWLRASIAWRLVKRTDNWLYWKNAVSGERFAIQSRRGNDEPIDGTFMRPGDIFWGREGWRMVEPEAQLPSRPLRPALPWKEWR